MLQKGSLSGARARPRNLLIWKRPEPPERVGENYAWLCRFPVRAKIKTFARADSGRKSGSFERLRGADGAGRDRERRKWDGELPSVDLFKVR